MKLKDEEDEVMSDWKFAAMVIDRSVSLGNLWWLESFREGIRKGKKREVYVDINWKGGQRMLLWLAVKILKKKVLIRPYSLCP